MKRTGREGHSCASTGAASTDGGSAQAPISARLRDSFGLLARFMPFCLSRRVPKVKHAEKDCNKIVRMLSSSPK